MPVWSIDNLVFWTSAKEFSCFLVGETRQWRGSEWAGKKEPECKTVILLHETRPDLNPSNYKNKELETQLFWVDVLVMLN